MANKFKILLAVAFSAVCFSCATAPENISPAYVSELSYTTRKEKRGPVISLAGFS